MGKDSFGQILDSFDEPVVLVPFNPTAENLAKYFVQQIAPVRLAGTGAQLVKLK